MDFSDRLIKIEGEEDEEKRPFISNIISRFRS
jgi:hypothetical protein